MERAARSWVRGGQRAVVEEPLGCSGRVILMGRSLLNPRDGGQSSRQLASLAGK